MGHIAIQDEYTFQVADGNILEFARQPDGRIEVSLCRANDDAAVISYLLDNSQVAALISWLQRRQNTGLVGG